MNNRFLKTIIVLLAILAFSVIVFRIIFLPKVQQVIFPFQYDNKYVVDTNAIEVQSAGEYSLYIETDFYIKFIFFKEDSSNATTGESSKAIDFAIEKEGFKGRTIGVITDNYTLYSDYEVYDKGEHPIYFLDGDYIRFQLKRNGYIINISYIFNDYPNVDILNRLDYTLKSIKFNK